MAWHPSDIFPPGWNTPILIRVPPPLPPFRSGRFRWSQGLFRPHVFLEPTGRVRSGFGTWLIQSGYLFPSSLSLFCGERGEIPTTMLIQSFHSFAGPFSSPSFPFVAVPPPSCFPQNVKVSPSSPLFLGGGTASQKTPSFPCQLFSSPSFVSFPTYNLKTGPTCVASSELQSPLDLVIH